MRQTSTHSNILLLIFRCASSKMVPEEIETLTYKIEFIDIREYSVILCINMWNPRRMHFTNIIKNVYINQIKLETWMMWKKVKEEEKK